MKMKTFLFLVFCGLSVVAMAGGTTRHFEPVTTTVPYRIGETVVLIKVSEYGSERTKVFINLHADEMTSVQAATRMLEEEGGLLIRIDNHRKRNIRFKLGGRYYQFDPNRIFSRDGIGQTLRQLGPTSAAAINAVDGFAQRLLKLIPAAAKYVVALHNNTDGKFGVSSYLPGADRQWDARKVYANNSQDDDDIFFTTDSILYERLAAERYNTILQDNVNVKRDGSLSVYCGERNIPYLNCETQHGKVQQYSEMIRFASRQISATWEEDWFDYTTDSTLALVLYPGMSIYAGDRAVGRIVSTVVLEDRTMAYGHLAMAKENRMLDNMQIAAVPDGDTLKLVLQVDVSRDGREVEPPLQIRYLDAVARE